MKFIAVVFFITVLFFNSVGEAKNPFENEFVALGTFKVKSKVKLKLDIDLPEGYKLNVKAPQRIEIYRGDELKPVYKFERSDVKDGMVLGMLKYRYSYKLSGTLYYCKKDKPSVCYIENLEFSLLPTMDGNEKVPISLSIPQK